MRAKLGTSQLLRARESVQIMSRDESTKISYWLHEEGERADVIKVQLIPWNALKKKPKSMRR